MSIKKQNSIKPGEKEEPDDAISAQDILKDIRAKEIEQREKYIDSSVYPYRSTKNLLSTKYNIMP